MTVYYSKTFQSGTLKGLTVHQELSFADNDAAFRFAKVIGDKNKVHRDLITNDAYRVTDLAFQKYARS